MLQLPHAQSARFTKSDIAAIQRNSPAVIAAVPKACIKKTGKIPALVKEYIEHSKRHASAVAKSNSIDARLAERGHRYNTSLIAVPKEISSLVGPEIRFSSVQCVREFLRGEIRKYEKELKALRGQKNMTSCLNRIWFKDCKTAIRKYTPAVIVAAKNELARKAKAIERTGQNELLRAISQEHDALCALGARIQATKLRSPECAFAILELALNAIESGKRRRRDKFSISVFGAERAHKHVELALSFLKQSA